jgi:hypothetical protein
VWLVDTPGFDDTYKQDSEILAEIAVWLTESYKQNRLLTGIIYLHRISDTRITGAAMKNLQMFKKLCRDDGLSKVILGTTFWEKVRPEKGSRNGEQLQSKPDFWGYLIAKGSKVFRHNNRQQSAEAIVRHLIERDDSRDKKVLAIQKEIVEDRMSLERTAAGIAMADEISKARREFELQLENFKLENERELRRKEEATTLLLQSMKAQLDAANQRATTLQAPLPAEAELSPEYQKTKAKCIVM